jgi:hypothetical protein
MCFTLTPARTNALSQNRHERTGENARMARN